MGEAMEGLSLRRRWRQTSVLWPGLPHPPLPEQMKSACFLGQWLKTWSVAPHLMHHRMGPERTLRCPWPLLPASDVCVEATLAHLTAAEPEQRAARKVW